MRRLKEVERKVRDPNRVIFLSDIDILEKMGSNLLEDARARRREQRLQYSQKMESIERRRSQKAKPKRSPSPKKAMKRIQPPGYEFHKPEKWFTWIHDNIDRIRKNPVLDGADKTVVHYLTGTHYRYKLEFPVVRNWFRRSLGTPSVYRKPRTWYWKKLNN